MLICPCGKEIYTEIEYGVRVYKHKETNAYCGKMNKFDVDINDLIGDAVYKAYKKQDIMLFQCYCYGQDTKTRIKIYKDISGIKNEKDAISALKFLFSDSMAFGVKVVIAQEMMCIFGRSEFDKIMDCAGIYCTAIIQARNSMNRINSVLTLDSVGLTKKLPLPKIKVDALREVKASEIMNQVDQVARDFIDSSNQRLRKRMSTASKAVTRATKMSF